MTWTTAKIVVVPAIQSFQPHAVRPIASYVSAVATTRNTLVSTAMSPASPTNATPRTMPGRSTRASTESDRQQQLETLGPRAPGLDFERERAQVDEDPSLRGGPLQDLEDPGRAPRGRALHGIPRSQLRREHMALGLGKPWQPAQDGKLGTPTTAPRDSLLPSGLTITIEKDSLTLCAYTGVVKNSVRSNTRSRMTGTSLMELQA